MQPPLPSLALTDDLRVLIVCDNASLVCGGESILPLHYLRLLRARGCAVWLVVHARCREELQALFPGDDQIVYVDETPLHRWLWRTGQRLPVRLAYDTTGLVSRLCVQLAQRRVIRRLVAEHGIQVVHQPVPVSPREPSLMTDLGAPVVIGPMNGGMSFPLAFRGGEWSAEQMLLRVGRACSALANRVAGGKRRAALLLVANARTRAALPPDLRKAAVDCLENGVELALWGRHAVGVPATSERANVALSTRMAPEAGPPSTSAANDPPCFAFVGRLLPLKAVDVLIAAFAAASRRAPMRLLVIGEGPAKTGLMRLAAESVPASAVRFTGWLSQTDCAAELERADCMVMPSLHDCGGAVVLEAMAMSKPVIATAWGGPVDYLDASCGILVTPASRAALIEGLADAMVWLARSPQGRAAMGRAGRAKVEALYDWDHHADAMLQHHRRVAAAAASITPHDVARPAFRRLVRTAAVGQPTQRRAGYRAAPPAVGVDGVRFPRGARNVGDPHFFESVHGVPANSSASSPCTPPSTESAHASHGAFTSA